MNDLNTMVSSFSKEDQNAFISYLNKKNKRTDTKNIQLFKLLLNTELSSKAICIKLYGTNKKDAYHALRKRLFQSIIHFSANTSLEEENSLQMDVIKYLLASRNYLHQKQFKVAYKILNKAESVAIEHHLYALLNEIYYTQIQYANSLPFINLNEVIEKFNINKDKHHLEDQLNIVYSKLKQKLNRTSSNTTEDFQTLLNKTLNEYDITVIDTMSFKSLYKLLSIISISAFATNSYLKIESFLIDSYTAILQKKEKEKQPFYHIQIVYHIANTLFRNKKFAGSLAYLQKMHKLMDAQRRKYYASFKLKYNLLLTLNLNFTNQQADAIEILTSFIDKKHMDIEASLDIHLSLIMFYFQKNDFKKSHKLFSKLRHSDKWYKEKAGKEWVIKKNLAEILLHIELNNIDLVDSKLLSFKRHHYKYLKSINQQRVITYLNLVQLYYKNPEQVTTTNFKNKVKDSFEWIENKEEDIFVMSFYAWLKSKIHKDTIYNTTIDLISIT